MILIPCIQLILAKSIPLWSEQNNLRYCELKFCLNFNYDKMFFSDRSHLGVKKLKQEEKQ